MSKKQIFKIQVSLMTNHDTPRALVYNKKRDIMGEFQADKDLVKFMNGEPKKFAFAKVANKKLQIDSEADWQDW